MDWQPIETAEPLKDQSLTWDQRRILVLMNARVKIAIWVPDQYAVKPRPFWHADGDQINTSRMAQPLHWMPLPEPPK